MLICHRSHTDTIQVYSVTVMTHAKALQAGHSSQGTSEPITPAQDVGNQSRKLEPVHRQSRMRIRFGFLHNKCLVTQYEYQQ